MYASVSRYWAEIVLIITVYSVYNNTCIDTYTFNDIATNTYLAQ